MKTLLKSTIAGSALLAAVVSGWGAEVTLLEDGGPGSLRQAILDAAPGETILLNVSGVIVLTNELAVNKDLSIVGPGAVGLAISGNLNSRVFTISSNVAVAISGLTIRDGHSPNGINGITARPGTAGAGGFFGGAVYNAGKLALTDCLLTNNFAGTGGTGGTGEAIEDHTWWGGPGGAGGNGGAIYNHESGELTLLRCTITGNSSGNGGRGGKGGDGKTGGVFEIGDVGGDGAAGGVGGSGGGIYNAGVLRASLCTISGNGDGSGGNGGNGGNGWVGSGDDGEKGRGGNGGRGGSGGGVSSLNNLFLWSCTIAANSAGPGGAGGSPGTSGEGATVWGTAGTGGSPGGIQNSGDAESAQIVNTIVALNTDAAHAPNNALGAFLSLGHNLIETTAGSTGFGVSGDQVGRPSFLQPLAENGGSTLTHALWPESPAVNAGDNTSAATFPTDQRGASRISCNTVDIGAFEYVDCSWLPHPAARNTLYFDGIDDYVQGGEVTLSNSSFTIEAWAKRDLVGTPDCILGQGTANTTRGLLFGFKTNSSFTFSFFTNSLDTSSVYPDRDWHHWAGTYDTNGQIRLIYLDGALVASNTAPAHYGGIGVLRIGDAPWGGWAFDGEIDEVRVWNIARSGEEIRQNLARTLTGTESGLVAYFRFDEEIGASVAIDSSRKGLNGTLNGNPAYLFSGAKLYQPIPTTLDASPVRATTATLRGRVNPAGPNETQVWFDYGTSPNFGTSTALDYVGTGLTPQTRTNQITGLQPGTKYYFRVVARNDAGTNYSGAMTFDTPVVGFGYPVTTRATSGQNTTSPRHTTDGDGNIYLTGLFSDAVQFKGTLRAEGSGTNAFVAKLLRGGDWDWAINIPVTNGQVQINALAMQDGRNVAIAGTFNGSATFGKTALTAEDSSAFVALLDPGTGAWSWVTPLGTNGSVNALAVGSDGGIYAAGRFSGTATLGSDTVTASGGSDILVAKLGSSGRVVWVKLAGGTEDDVATALALGANDAIFVTGSYRHTANFGSISLTSAGNSDLFFARLNPTNGLFDLAIRAGGGGEDIGTGLALDPTGPVYLAGQFEGEADFKGATLPELAPGHSYLLVTQMDTQGTLLRRTLAQSARASSITVNRSGRVYVAGDFAGVMTYGKTSTPVSTSGSRDVFLAQLVPDNEGGLAWEKLDRIGSIGLESSGSVSVDLKGSVVVSGTYSQSLVLGFVQLSTANTQEIFVARFDPDGTYEHNRWTIGLTLNVPAEAQDPNYSDGRAIGYPYSIEVLQTPKELPDSDGMNSFFWNDTEKKLYAIRPVTVRIKWPLSPKMTDLSNVATVVGRCFWPDYPQSNVAGAPVELEGPAVGSGFSYGEILFNTNGASVTPVTRGTDQFQVFQTAAGASGYNVIRYTQPGGQSAFEVVYTRPYGNWAATNLAFAGNELKREGHADSTGKNGYVFYERSFYDGSVHTRATRTGSIIPVNRNLHNDPERDLVVIWYRTNALTGVAWGSDPVRYMVTWREDAKLVIAKGRGFELAPLESYPQVHVYRQPDNNLAGFNPNEEHALIIGSQLYALRCDLNDTFSPKTSEPYVLLKYLDPARPVGDTNSWRVKVVKVVAEEAPYWFTSFASGQAGLEVQLPAPLNLLPLCGSSNRIAWGTNYAHQAWNGKIFAKSAGYLQVTYWYPIQPDFDVGTNNWPVGMCVPWMSQYAQTSVSPGATHVLGDPVLVGYDISWPADVAVLESGETLTSPKRGLPDLLHFASAQVIYDDGNPQGTTHSNALVRIFDPLSERTIQLADTFKLPDDIAKANDRGRWVFPDLPWHIRIRLFYDELNQRLSFGGWYDSKFGAGEPLLLPNILSPHERDRVIQQSEDNDFRTIITNLYNLSRNPNQVDVDQDGEPDKELRVGLITQILLTNKTEILVGPVTPGPDGSFVTYTTNEVTQAVSSPVTNVIQQQFGDLPKALTAALRFGSGYVSVVENDDPRLPGQPINVHVLSVTNRLFTGDLKVVPSDYVFDERLTLRHSGDFGGEPQNYEFEWYYQPDQDGVSPPLPVLVAEQTNWNGWISFPTPPSGSSNGHNDITLGEGGNLSSLMVLSDNWLLCRYRAFTDDGPTVWSDWVGEPGGGRAILAEGWIKRVMKGLNAFDSRVKDFHNAPAATYASMILQAGERYEGSIAFNSDPNYLNQLGLIQSYETVLDRGRKLSIDGLPAVNFGPANNALLLAAGRIADLYMLLGNEAYADASDPTIGFTTSSGTYGNLAPSIFCFQNQLDSPLEEELALLRGRDDSGMTVRAEPLYNRLIWNFTLGEGEVAYSQHYNISDQNQDGFIDEKDARILYPQGHGDAWGHYLTSTKKYYDLLRHPNYTWIPRPEAVLVGGVSVQVDYLDERKFAATAAAKAKTGAEVVNLTYGEKYVEDPAGQWQGYKDTQPNRAWGVSEWATRAGTGAYFDWVVANAILPATDPNTNHVGIQKIDRTTVTELGEIPAQFSAIEGQLNAVDRGLNPLGLAAGTMPFDIDPSKVAAGQTHFDQIYQRALKAMENALALFDHVNTLSQNLRRNQDTVDAFNINVNEKERDYKNRLIEIFGYPFTGDVGPGGTYPSGYDGPDLYHYMYVNATDITGERAQPRNLLTTYFQMLNFDETITPFFPEDWTGHVTDSSQVFTVQFPLCEEGKYKFAAPSSWGQRSAQGTLQDAISETLKARVKLSQGLGKYNNLRLQIQDQLDLLKEKQDTHDAMMLWRRGSQFISGALNTAIVTTKSTEVQANFIIETWDKTTDIAVESLPKSVGFSTDVFAPSRGVLKLGAKVGQVAMRQLAANANIAQTLYANAKEIVQNEADIEIAGLAEDYEIEQKAKEIKQLLREEAEKRLDLLTLQEALRQAHEDYLTTLARGQCLLEERYNFRIKTAGQVQEYRYQDMAFRIFQNDALQKYRAQFDLAARYVYLTAKAYDYETCLLNTETGAGSELLTSIVRQRTLGQVVRQGTNLQPISGRHGLADPLARLSQNFEVYRGQLGFTTPETETGRFSLRSELFRIRSGDLQTNALSGTISTNQDWNALLQQCRVPDLWEVPEFRRFCRPFAPESAGPQPGLVIRIPTTVTFGLNYFGWPLGPGDSAYDPSRFATKVRSAGVWFEDYNLAGLSMTPRVYLVPAGLDILRSPSGNDLETREFNVVDQKLPVPFPIGSSDLSNPSWIPINDSLSEAFGDIRRFSSFRAYHDQGWFDEKEATQDTRLIGRSVWNTEWMLIIPGGTFLYEPNRGLDTFIATVGDIKIFFQTYSYSGN